MINGGTVTLNAACLSWSAFLALPLFKELRGPCGAAVKIVSLKYAIN